MYGACGETPTRTSAVSRARMASTFSRSSAIDALALRRIGTEHLAIADAAHAALEHGVEADARVAGVGEGRDAGAQSLLDAEPRRVEQVVVREHGAARVREPEDPLAEGETVEKAAHRGELEVAVRVDETGQEQRVAEIDVGPVTRRRAPSRGPT